MNYNTLLALAPSLQPEMLRRVAAALGEAPAAEVRILIGTKLNQMAAQMLADAERVAGDLRTVADRVTEPVTIWRVERKTLVEDLRDALAGLIEHASPPVPGEEGTPAGEAWDAAFVTLQRADREMPPKVPA